MIWPVNDIVNMSQLAFSALDPTFSKLGRKLLRTESPSPNFVKWHSVETKVESAIA